MDLAKVGLGLTPQVMPTKQSTGLCNNELCGVELHSGCFEFPLVGLICLSCGIRLYCGRLAGVRRPLPPQLPPSSFPHSVSNIPLPISSIQYSDHRYLSKHSLYFHDDDDVTTAEEEALTSDAE